MINICIFFFLGDLLAEIETDKATMGFETPEEGYLAKILIQAGQKDVPIGKLVCIIVENESDVAAFKDFKDSGLFIYINQHIKYVFEINLNLKKKKGSSAPKPAAAAAPAPAAAAPAPPPPPISVSTPEAPRPMTAVEQRGPRVYASPMAKRLAETQALRLEGQGSGAYGSITSKDLGSMSAGGAASAPAPVPTGAAYIDIPVSNTRAIIAKRLLESKVTIPHYYLTVDINVDKVSK